ncbi:extensin family protein [Microvirga sp. ACRRW]|uniref:extensin-like domain-containing protein n=1 Tax=Microvirga sp. ACRRW TaxID=2918205 RepID=UPI001EF6910A|nr:extensin family protein [Microvirga sp. ACRRW]MCG7391764.1 extensin family protein [Microvirga sp. ACRRW]
MQPLSTPHHRTRILPVLLGRLALTALIGGVVLSGLVWGGVIDIPRHLNPFVPLRIADDVNWLTRIKLSRLDGDTPQCLAVLANSDVSYKPVADRVSGDGCGLSDAVEIGNASRALSRNATATCPLAVAWALFDEHVVGPAAREHLGQDVVRIVHVGTYACRNINHRDQGRRSEHATANAIDIAAFVLADGRQVTVRRDWEGGDQRHAAFLRAVRDGACTFFDVVLSPDYNEAHHDHFHFDMGSYRACR